MDVILGILSYILLDNNHTGGNGKNKTSVQEVLSEDEDEYECPVCWDDVPISDTVYCCNANKRKICTNCFKEILNQISLDNTFYSKHMLKCSEHKKFYIPDKFDFYGIRRPNIFNNPVTINIKNHKITKLRFNKLPEFLGSGTFGITYKVNVDIEHNNYDCIIKIQKPNLEEYKIHEYFYKNIPKLIPKPIFNIILNDDNVDNLKKVILKLFPDAKIISDDIQLYFMEFIDGISLKDKCEKSDFCKKNKIRICNVIKLFNNYGLHKDLHGENIILKNNTNSTNSTISLIDPENLQIKIIDFGTSILNPTKKIENIKDPIINCNDT